MKNTPAGKLYLGNIVNPKTQDTTDEKFHYDAYNFTTHGVIVGMTGSGKTGLSIGLLEEALHNDIPTIIIDPKGDMPNLALQFPDLSPAEFLPWINKGDAKRRNMPPEEYAGMVSRSWEFGLGKSGIGKDRIKKLIDNVDFRIYTPGSDSGISLNILDSFRAPPISADENAEAFSEAVESTTQSLLGLVGIEGDPLQSREFILISNILQDRWKEGEDLTLESIIGYVMNPPVKKIGVFDVETLYPKNERMQLAMLLNNVIASPGFSTWLKGEPMNPEQWVSKRNGKTPCSIFYISHLSDSERMFFVTLLLSKIMNYVRTLPGTSGLRILLYFDEVFGYLPPHPKNPPSKTPILTILKQARAFGLGMVLATQNPVDLDYKALTNAGTWFIGKLRTDRDKKRILDGLESSSLSTDGREMEKLISSLETRNFILHSVHRKEPVAFHTRFTQAYLRGPITRVQIKSIEEKLQSVKSAPSLDGNGSPKVGNGKFSSLDSRFSTPNMPGNGTKPVNEDESSEYSAVMSDLPKSLGSYYLTEEACKSQELMNILRPHREKSKNVLYRPALMAKLKLRFDEEKARLVHYKELYRMVFPLHEDSMPNWPDENTPLEDDFIAMRPYSGALFASPPRYLLDEREAKNLINDLVDIIYGEESINILKNQPLKMFGEMGESIDDFERRCSCEVESKMEREEEKIRRRYERTLNTKKRKFDRKMQRLEDLKQESSLRKTTEVVDIGESILGIFTKKKKSIGRSFSRALNKRRYSGRAEQRVKETEVEIEHLSDEMERIKNEMDDELNHIRNKYADMVTDIEETEVTLEKNDIRVVDYGVLWVLVGGV
ncbi:MAG: DUF87 domain-containing protein [Candidatus Eremiobacteraeota bacterium]|nr:DUF87 domain-containing protein [Candidatus Eremiobacteraeota bacterium]